MLFKFNAILGYVILGECLGRLGFDLCIESTSEIEKELADFNRSIEYLLFSLILAFQTATAIFARMRLF